MEKNQKSYQGLTLMVSEDAMKAPPGEGSNQQPSAAWQLQTTATGSKTEYPEPCNDGSLQVTGHPLVRLKA